MKKRKYTPTMDEVSQLFPEAMAQAVIDSLESGFPVTGWDDDEGRVVTYQPDDPRVQKRLQELKARQKLRQTGGS